MVDADLERLKKRYAELKSGDIEFRGRKIPTTPLSSYVRAREIAEELKAWIDDGAFTLSEPAELLPSADTMPAFHPLPERPVNNRGVK